MNEGEAEPRVGETYVLRRFDGIYDEDTIAKLRTLYVSAASRLPPEPKTLRDLSVVEREGRADVLLASESVTISQAVLDFVASVMDEAVVLQPWVRGFMVTGPRPAQPWHFDFVAFVPFPRPVFATLIVALDDVTEDMGATELCVKRLPDDGILEARDLDQSVALRVLLKRNQGLLFDGRISHRGAGSLRERVPIMYHVFERGL
jgi:ectoine hydroxylase-related dioxygenase (phytanoyl-CoA dioxygenase family)